MDSQETAVHPTAVVMPGAELGRGVEVGPYCVIEPGVEVGDGCKLHPFVHLLGRTTIGGNTVIGTGSVLGGEPQDKAYSGESTSVQIGSGCRFYENVTVHRATKEGSTVLGDDVMVMAGAHVGHNARVDDGAILVNNAAVGGHGHVGERAFLSAYSAVHQFGKVGRLTLVGGATMLSQDAAPFSIVVGSYPPIWRGINAVGLKRAGFSSEQRSAIRRALFAIFSSPGSQHDSAQEFLQHDVPEVVEVAEFVLNSPRGVCGPARKS